MCYAAQKKGGKVSPKAVAAKAKANPVSLDWGMAHPSLMWSHLLKGCAVTGGSHAVKRSVDNYDTMSHRSNDIVLTADCLSLLASCDIYRRWLLRFKRPNKWSTYHRSERLLPPTR